VRIDGGGTGEDTGARHRGHGGFGMGAPRGPIRGRARGRALRVVGLAAAAALATAAVRRSLLVVRGPSMRPTLEAGDVVVTLPLPPAPPLPAALRGRLLRPGQLVVLADPQRPDHRIVKRVTEVHPDGLEVRGDDPGWSIDSRVFGRVAPAQVRRLVLGRWPARRRQSAARGGASGSAEA
jgi:hypothetical protein